MLKLNSALIQSIFKECQNGREEALAILYSESITQIRRQLQKVGIQHADVEDIIQDTMVRVFAKIEQVRDPNCYAVWLFRVTKSVYLAFFTKRKRFCVQEISECFTEQRAYMLPQSYLEKINIIEIIHSQISGLKKPMQEVLILKYIKELSDEEISMTLKVPKGTVKSRIHYAKLRLQHMHMI